MREGEETGYSVESWGESDRGHYPAGGWFSLNGVPF